MRSRSSKFTSKVVQPTAEPVPPATWNRGNSTFCGPPRSRCGPAYRNCALSHTKALSGLLQRPTWNRGDPHVSLSPPELRGSPHRSNISICRDIVGLKDINSDISKSKTSFSRSTPVQIQCAPIDRIVNGNSHTIGSNNEYNTPDKRIHRTLLKPCNSSRALFVLFHTYWA